MRRFRVTIARLMTFIFLLGFGFAALRNANPFWASASFSLAVIAVSVAVVGALARRGEARTSWAGFAIASGACLVIRISTHGTVGSLNGPPRPLLYALQQYVNPMASSGRELIAYAQTCLSLEVVLLGLAGAVLGHLVAVKDDRPGS
jgi:hypothetical protein